MINYILSPDTSMYNLTTRVAAVWMMVLLSFTANAQEERTFLEKYNMIAHSKNSEYGPEIVSLFSLKYLPSIQECRLLLKGRNITFSDLKYDVLVYDFGEFFHIVFAYNSRESPQNGGDFAPGVCEVDKKTTTIAAYDGNEALPRAELYYKNKRNKK